MTDTPFKEFSNLCKALEKKSSTLEKRRLITNFLKRLSPDEWKPFILLVTGKVLPEIGERSLYIGYSTIKQAFKRKVMPLVQMPPPTIIEVYKELQKIARLSGSDISRKRVDMLSSLLSRMSDDEKEYLIRAISGEMRIGAVTGLVLQALADAKNIDIDRLRRVYLVIGDIGEVSELLAKNELDLKTVRPNLFNPIKPMLASSADNIEEAIQQGGGHVAVEVKYDGVRVQIHKKKGEIRIFSRRLTDVTNSLPEIVELVRERINADETILEGEVIGVNREGNPLSFQELMKRFKRIKNFDEVSKQIPVRLYLFDILYINGALTVDIPYYKRYELLKSVVPRELLAERIVTSDLDEVKAFYKRAVEKGHEGIMIKKLDAPYVMGARGANWIKVKEVETIDVVIVGAEWGHGRRKNWLSDYYLAVYDPENDEFLIVGKTFKGLTDEEFEWITKKLLELKIGDEGYRVWVKPEIVVEVAFNEVQKSPRYRSGLALRFARITNFRPDKSPKDITTIDELKEIYMRERMRSILS